MLLDEAKVTDLTATASDVAQAERAADEAEEALADLERAAITDEAADPLQIARHREIARTARARIRPARQRAERAAQARRLLALAELGEDIDELATNVATDGAFAAAVQKVVDSVAGLRQLCTDHDQAVEALITRAQELAVEPLTGGGGPQPTSAYVGLAMGGGWHRRGVLHGRTKVRSTTWDFQEALTHAVEGDADGAIARLIK